MKLIQAFQNARSDPGKVVLEGFHAIKHALRFGATIEQCVARKGSDFETLVASHAPELARQFSERTEFVDEHTFAHLSPHPPETGIIAIAHRRQYTLDDLEKTNRPIVLLDHPTHPGNVGAVIRVCAAANCAGVLVLGDIDPWVPPVVRGAAGLQFALPVMRIDAFPKTDRCVVLFDERGEEFTTEFQTQNTILIFGSERHGTSNALKQHADKMIRIPMKEGVSSLNLATSVAIMVYR